MANPLIREGLREELEKTPGDFVPGVGIGKYISSAGRTVKLARKHWDPGEANGLPVAGGFKSLGLPVALLDETEELVAWAWEANRVERTADSKERAALRKATRRVLSTLRAIAGWHQHKDAGFRLRFETLQANHDRMRGSAEESALQLQDYVALLKPVSEQIDGVAGFDLATLDEASGLADSLSEPGRSRRVRLLRNRLVEMLEARYVLLREGGRLVFAKHPHLAESLTYRTRRLGVPVEEESVEASADEGEAVEGLEP